MTLVRDVKRVRRYAVQVEKEFRCHFCGKPAVDKFRYIPTGELYPLCGFHVEEFVNGTSWDVVREVVSMNPLEKRERENEVGI